MMNIDCHVHTKYSFDSLMGIEKIIKIACKKNISGIVICDHNYFSYPKLKKKLNNVNKQFFILPGIEIKTELGDLIGIMINESIKSKNFLECIDEIKSQGGISILPHPFRRKVGINVRELADNVNWLEVNNARSTKEQNSDSIKLGKKLNKPITAGSDAHLYREIGESYITINDISNVEELIKEIIRKDVKIKEHISSRRVHYWSSIIGTIKTKQYGSFIKGIGREIKSGLR